MVESELFRWRRMRGRDPTFSWGSMGKQVDDRGLRRMMCSRKGNKAIRDELVIKEDTGERGASSSGTTKRGLLASPELQCAYRAAPLDGESWCWKGGPDRCSVTGGQALATISSAARATLTLPQILRKRSHPFFKQDKFMQSRSIV